MKVLVLVFVFCASRNAREKTKKLYSDKDLDFLELDNLDDSALSHRAWKALSKLEERALAKEGTSTHGFTEIYNKGRCNSYYSPPNGNQGYRNNYPLCFQHCRQQYNCAYVSIYNDGGTCVFSTNNHLGNQCAEKFATAASVWKKSRCVEDTNCVSGQRNPCTTKCTPLNGMCDGCFGSDFEEEALVSETAVQSRLAHALKRTKLKIELRLSQLHRLKRRESKIGHRLSKLRQMSSRK